MTKDKSNQIAIIGLILTSIGILVPILYSKFQDKSTILIEQENLTTIISKPSNLDSLQIFYKHEPISNLSKLNLILSNNSKLSVVEDDFIHPINIELSDKIKIISYEIENTQPKGIATKITTDSLLNSLNLKFELLNPNDKVRLGIIFTGELVEPKISGRIKGIKIIDYKITNGKINYIIAAIVLTFVILSLIFLYVVDNERKSSLISKKRFLMQKDDYIDISIDDYPLLIFSHFSHHPNSSITKLINKIRPIFDNEKITNKSLAVSDIIINALDDNISSNAKARVVGGIITAIGIIYLIVWFLNNDIFKNGI